MVAPPQYYYGSKATCQAVDSVTTLKEQSKSRLSKREHSPQLKDSKNTCSCLIVMCLNKKNNGNGGTFPPLIATQSQDDLQFLDLGLHFL